MIRKLKAMPYAQAQVTVYDNGSIKLTSYTTDVIYISKEGWFEITGLYSMTTRKHIGAFMKEYCNSNYQLAKEIYLSNYKFNIYTGEII